MGTQGITISNERVLYTEDKFNYGIKVENNSSKNRNVKLNSSVYLNSEELIDVDISTKDSIQTLKTPSDDDFYNGIVSSYTVPPQGQGQHKTIRGADSFTPRLQSSFLRDGEDGGNCSPANFTNMLQLWRHRGKTKISSDPDVVYREIVRLSGYDVAEGGLTRAKGVKAAKDYAEDVGYKASSFNYWSDPISYFRNDIFKGHTIPTSISSETDGHLVIVVGIVETEYKDMSWLRVIDGWSTHTNRYLIFNDYYKNIRGTRWNII